MAEYGWKLSDLAKVKPNGCRVFSTFACGGGSTMGYKLAGYEVVGANDIDPEMAEVYRANHKPKHYYLKPIGQLVEQLRKEGLPEHLQSLDILDGSPPCSSFSMGGARDRDWGKEKKFREGQAQQVLDDLFFDYLNLLEIIQPRTFIAENVPGILIGKAKGYAKAIVRKAREIGYATQVFEVDATSCGVPQSRKRVFFVGTRENHPKLLYCPNSKIVGQAEACSDLTLDPSDVKRATLKAGSTMRRYWEATKSGRYFSDTHPKGSLYTWKKNDPAHPVATIVAAYVNQCHGLEPRKFTWKELLRLGSFPDDYDLREPNRKKWNEKACYLVGMSVPPFMVRDLSSAIYKQWLT
jgi:DNA (cytosine-5)-methyltransferase 1